MHIVIKLYIVKNRLTFVIGFLCFLIYGFIFLYHHTMTKQRKALDKIQMSLINFFKNLTDESGLTLREIANEIGVNHPQTVLNKLNQLVAKWYFVKDGKGFRLLRERVDDEKINNIVYLPIYGFAQCGNQWKAILQEYSQETLPITTALIGTGDLDHCFFVRAKGNSMEPKIQDWDLVLIRQQDHYDLNDYVFVVHNTLPKLKKIIKQKGTFMLESVNRFFDKVEISPLDDTKIIGVVKRVIKNWL